MKTTRLLFVSVLFWILLHEPFISVANRPVLVAGVPLLYAYIFGLWAVMIVLMAWAFRRSSVRRITKPPDE